MQLVSRSYSALSVEELYQILKLRVDVFVVEQKCAYPELDNYDQAAQHILAINEEGLAGYARVLPPDTVYKEASIGRVCIKKEERNKQFGRKLFDFSLQTAKDLFLQEPIKIQAQTYLEDFYASYGFKTITEPYLDFGIAHVDMILEIHENE